MGWRQLSVVCLLLNVVIIAQADQTKTGCRKCNPTVPGMANVHLVPHSHDDAGWLKTVDEYFSGEKPEIQNACINCTITTVIQELLKDKTRKFIQVETAYFWRWWMGQDEGGRQQARSLINSGQLEIAGGGWASTDEATTHYISLIDNMDLGLNWLKDNVGACAVPTVAWQVDPFGHSKEHSRLLAEMGFDGQFFARIDFRDFAERKTNRNLNMVVEGGEPGDRAQSLLTGVLMAHYSEPQGFCFDIICSPRDEILESNLDRYLRSFAGLVEEKGKEFRESQHLLIPMGNDFHYQEAGINYRNMDKLILEMNKRSNATKIHVLYSSPACYLDAINAGGGVAYPLKTDDFFPYADRKNGYWTGYFTSKPALKLQERLGARDLAVCNQLDVLGPRTPSELTFDMRRAMGLLQHHDAVTGTARDQVCKDYSQRLYKAAAACQRRNSEIFSTKGGFKNLVLDNFEQSWCPKLNSSECRISEDSENFILTAYNPLSRPVSHFVRIPVKKSKYQVYDATGRKLPVQVNQIPHHVLKLPGRNSSAKYELIFKLGSIPALGFMSVYVSAHAKPNSTLQVSKMTSLPGPVARGGVTLGTSHSPVNFSVNMNFYTPSGLAYPSARPSGAYIFSPSTEGKQEIDKKDFYEIVGSIVNETIVTFDNIGALTLRQYLGRKDLEVVWQAGPLPHNNRQGMEVVIVYTSHLKSNGVFMTDSNGRQMVKRVRQEASKSGQDFITRNYYPITSRIELTDGEQLMSVLPDRSEGGSSQQDGQLELMVHRRLFRDDGLGVGETLNEMEYDSPLVAAGKHRLLIGLTLQEVRMRMAENVSPPQLSLYPTKISRQEWREAGIKDYSAVSIKLPEHIEIISLAVRSPTTVILRFQNILESQEGGKTTLITIPPDMFSEFLIEDLVEMNLSGDRQLDSIVRMNWKIEGETAAQSFSMKPSTESSRNKRKVVNINHNSSNTIHNSNNSNMSTNSSNNRSHSSRNMSLNSSSNNSHKSSNIGTQSSSRNDNKRQNSNNLSNNADNSSTITYDLPDDVTESGNDMGPTSERERMIRLEPLAIRTFLATVRWNEL